MLHCLVIHECETLDIHFWPPSLCKSGVSFINSATLFSGPKRDAVTGERRELHSEELHILYSSPNIIRQIKSRRMRWAGHVARMEEESVQGFDRKARRKETT
jgi:hypothetical protein